MGLLGRGRLFINRAKAQADGRPAVYCRGDAEAWLTVWPGDADRDEVLNPTQGTRVNDRERAYRFDAAEYFAAGFVEPQDGDRITETLNGEPVTWEVCPRDREPCWVWADSDHTRIRVHTRRVD
jgi:hypothetical protein